MKRRFHIWAAFGFCAGVVFIAMAGVTLIALRLDHAQAESRRQAALEEAVRLALWRMDSSLAALIAQEGTRPYFAYSSFYPAERAYTRMFEEIRQGEVLMPSPLLAHTQPRVILHFQFSSDGRLTSPQVPTGNMRDLAEAGYLAHEEIEENAHNLALLEKKINRPMLLAALDRMPPASAYTAMESAVPSPTQQMGPQPQAVAQIRRSAVEFEKRVQQAAMNVAVVSPQQQEYLDESLLAVPRKAANEPAAEVLEEAMRPVWLGDDLILARRVFIGKEVYLQGCLLDWPAIREQLHADIADLLPEADLAPVKPESSPENPGRLLASLPIELVPGTARVMTEQESSPVPLSLAIAWSGALLAGVAIAILLRGVLALSERRGAFVSAVTHELRTPLTTFRMYTEMLADGLIKDDVKKQRYLETLHAESGRLTHLVENVLAYARLERGRAVSPLEPVTLGAAVERMQDRLTHRAREADMELIVEMEPQALAASLRTDLSAVEQILMNLVDNACKYARAATDRRIHLEGRYKDSMVILRVSDHGPGIGKTAVRRLFRPFSKSARDAANSAPGVGLGLALSRRLARRLGGDLRHVSVPGQGACFELSLPVLPADAAS